MTARSATQESADDLPAEDWDRSFLISPVLGYSPQVGRLVSMLRIARSFTLGVVAPLRPAQLDYLHEKHGNSIARLIAHLAAYERICQIETFEEREVSEADLAEWKGVMPLSKGASTPFDGKNVEYLMAVLSGVRDTTLKGLATKDDEWLETPHTHRGGYPTNNHFLWFHLLEQEFFHRGHMVWLARWSAGERPGRPLQDPTVPPRAKHRSGPSA